MSPVLVEHAAQAVVLLRLNRPEARNALNNAVRGALAGHFRDFGEDSTTRCIVLTGDAKAFAAGADLKEVAALGAREMMQTGVRRLWKAIADCPKPVIAAVNGFALGGGCELAMHADIIVAGEGARFGQPELGVGVIPGGGGTQRLVRAVGKFRAMKMLLTGEMVDARQALEMGLVSEVVPDADVLDRALALARRIAELPPIAVMLCKEVVLTGQDCPLDAALNLERKAFELLFATEDQKEGMRAFAEKRKPDFQGR
ncbi:MAG: enoyl-CoA hydratase [Betaproteobacteria bacterium RIFCSPLOWO2_02_FULL_68_150]|nr:MAG: enoyl-CoA hydratase [Betaproteobacteria bacterium RIFCSPLOWO2_02_FULL_68_150]